MSSERGKFIVLEGGVGCGKTTIQSRLANNYFSSDWFYYREPGSTPFGEKIRDAVQGLYDYKVHPYAELLSYCAARANLIRGEIIPKLKEGGNVCLDRYWYSTFAYQGARGVSKPLIVVLNIVATEGLVPDLVLHYDVSPKLGMMRKFNTSGNGDVDRLDLESLEFHTKVRENYHQLARMHCFFGWNTIDASGAIEDVYQKSVKILQKKGIIYQTN